MSKTHRLLELRLEQDLSRGDSFTTIAASGSNGAVIHYRPTEETDARVNDSAVFLGKSIEPIEAPTYTLWLCITILVRGNLQWTLEACTWMAAPLT